MTAYYLALKGLPHGVGALLSRLLLCSSPFEVCILHVESVVV